MLIVAMDANFRLWSRLRGTWQRDSSLAPGWAYFVENGSYVDFIKNYVDVEEVSFPALLSMTLRLIVHLGAHLRGVPGPP